MEYGSRAKRYAKRKSTPSGGRSASDRVRAHLGPLPGGGLDAQEIQGLLPIGLASGSGQGAAAQHPLARDQLVGIGRASEVCRRSDEGGDRTITNRPDDQPPDDQDRGDRPDSGNQGSPEGSLSSLSTDDQEGAPERLGFLGSVCPYMTVTEDWMRDETNEVAIVCYQCGTLGTFLDRHAEHYSAMVDEFLYEIIFRHLQFERRGEIGAESLIFYLHRTKQVAEQLEAAGTLLAAGHGMIPVGLWEIEVKSLPMADFYKERLDTLPRFMELCMATKAWTLGEASLRLSVPRPNIGVTLCPGRAAIGTEVQCSCPDHIQISRNAWSIAFGQTDWVVMPELDGKVKIRFRPTPQVWVGAKDSLKKWTDDHGFQAIGGREEIPPGKWEVPLADLWGLGGVKYRLVNALVSLRTLRETLESLEESEFYYTCVSKLDESDKEYLTEPEPVRPRKRGPVLSGSPDEEPDDEEVSNLTRGLTIRSRGSPFAPIPRSRMTRGPVTSTPIWTEEDKENFPPPRILEAMGEPITPEARENIAGLAREAAGILQVLMERVLSSPARAEASENERETTAEGTPRQERERRPRLNRSDARE